MSIFERNTPNDSKGSNLVIPRGQAMPVKWYDKRVITICLIAAPLFFLFLYANAMRYEPPAGKFFEREPIVSGVYKCCGDNAKYPEAWVGNIRVSCYNFGYYGVGVPRCGKQHLNGLYVDVTRIRLPSFFKNDPTVVTIAASGEIHYQISDRRLREEWISTSTSDSVYYALTLTSIVYLVVYLYLVYFHRPKLESGGAR